MAAFRALAAGVKIRLNLEYSLPVHLVSAAIMGVGAHCYARPMIQTWESRAFNCSTTGVLAYCGFVSGPSAIVATAGMVGLLEGAKYLGRQQDLKDIKK